MRPFSILNWIPQGIVVRCIEFLLFVGLLFLSVRTNYRHPEWNFDLVGYVAVIASQSHDSPKEIQRITYESIAKGAPKGNYQKLSASSPYRKALSNRPETLMTQIRMYRNKPGYLAAVTLLHRCGVNLARATFIVSLIAYVLLAFIIRWWLRKRIPVLWAGILSICLMLSHPIFLAARMSAPDMLAALFIVPGMLMLMDKKWKWGFALLLLSIPIRPDAILLVGLVCVGFWLWPQPWLTRKTVTFLGLGALALHFGMNTLVDPYPHRVLLKHALTTRLYEPARMAETITWAEYVEGLRKSIFVHGYTLYPSPLWLFGFLAGLAVLLARTFRMPTTTVLVVSCCLYIGIHILLFPIRNDRFFTGHYLVMALAAAHMIAKAVDAKAGTKAQL